MKKVCPILFLVLLSCGMVNTEDSASIRTSIIKEGHWLFSLNIGEETIPFNAFYTQKNDSARLIIKNADEVIVVDDITLKGDSLFIVMPVFGTRFSARILSDTLLNGIWYNTTKSNDYSIPFTAVYGIEDRFEKQENNLSQDFAGRWEVTFSPEDENFCKAIGLFNQSDKTVKGTFLTETGDYRFLEGAVVGNEMKLSCFDGAHAFLFSAEIDAQNELHGHFWSGNHWTEDWMGKHNDAFKLRAPDSITWATSTIDRASFRFPDLSGREISLADDQFEGKVVIIQIMGTWCPNCADESKDFARLYKNYKDRGLEIIAVAYERSEDLAVSSSRINQFKNEVSADYTFLFGGKVGKHVAKDDFSFLNGIFSYPTSIFIDRNGKIRKVFTGYYGPGTGKYYQKYLEETDMLVDKLLSEGINS